MANDRSVLDPTADNSALCCGQRGSSMGYFDLDGLDRRGNDPGNVGIVRSLVAVV